MAISVAGVAATALSMFGGSSVINGVIFIVGAFLSTFLTKASKLMALGVWTLGAVLCAVAVFYFTMHSVNAATHLAADAADLSGNEVAQTATHAVDTAATVAGGIGGIFFGIVSFFVTWIASIFGFVIGAIARPKPAAVEAPAQTPA